MAAIELVKKNTGVFRFQAIIPNAVLQAVVPFNMINLRPTGSFPVGVVGAFCQYINGTSNLIIATNPTISIYYNSADLCALFQDASGTKIEIANGEIAQFIAGYDPSAPAYVPYFTLNSIELSFDGIYQQGDGDLLVTLLLIDL